MCHLGIYNDYYREYHQPLPIEKPQPKKKTCNEQSSMNQNQNSGIEPLPVPDGISISNEGGYRNKFCQSDDITSLAKAIALDIFSIAEIENKNLGGYDKGSLHLGKLDSSKTLFFKNILFHKFPVSCNYEQENEWERLQAVVNDYFRAPRSRMKKRKAENNVPDKS